MGFVFYLICLLGDICFYVPDAKRVPQSGNGMANQKAPQSKNSVSKDHKR